MKLYIDNSWIKNEFNDLRHLHIFDFEKLSLTENLNEAGIILQDYFKEFSNFKGKKVLVCMEPGVHKDYHRYDLVISTHKEYPVLDNIIYYPFMFFYLNSHKYLNYILNRHITGPVYERKFCCFITSNETVWQRIDFCRKLMQYKKVDCYGKVLRNCPEIKDDWWEPTFLNLVRQYKFMICFENSDKDGYITEKVANAYLGDTIPIYWGNKNACEYLNKKSMVLLEDYKESDINNALSEIILLDNDNEAYMAKIMEPLLKDNKVPEEFNLDKLRKEVYSRLL